MLYTAVFHLALCCRFRHALYFRFPVFLLSVVYEASRVFLMTSF